MARPTSYTKDTIALCESYLANCYGSDKLPTVEGLSLHLGVTRKTIHNWAVDPKKPEFLLTLETIKAAQAEQLVQRGITGDYNATIVKLMLHNHGYSDKQHTQLSGVDGNPIEVDHTLVIEVVDVED